MKKQQKRQYRLIDCLTNGLGSSNVNYGWAVEAYNSFDGWQPVAWFARHWRALDYFEKLNKEAQSRLSNTKH